MPFLTIRQDEVAATVTALTAHKGPRQASRVRLKKPTEACFCTSQLCAIGPYSSERNPHTLMIKQTTRTNHENRSIYNKQSPTQP